MSIVKRKHFIWNCYGDKETRVFFLCSSCRKNSTLSSHKTARDVAALIFEPGYPYENIYLTKCSCPNCGDEITAENTQYFYGRKKESLINYKVRTVEDKVIFHFTDSVHSFDPKTKKIKGYYLDYATVFNTKTGQTYCLAPKTGKRFNKKIRRVTNVSYGRTCVAIERYFKVMNEVMSKEIYQAIRENYKKKGIDMPYFKSPAIGSLIFLALVNRFPLLNPDIVNAFRNSYQNNSIYKRMRKIKNTDLAGQKDIISAFKVKKEHQTKSFKRAVYQNPRILSHYEFAKSIKSIDSLIKLLKTFDEWFEHQNMQNIYIGGLPISGPKLIKIFLKAFFKRHKESVAVNKLRLADGDIFKDVCELYYKVAVLRKADVSFAGTLHEIHDRLYKMHDEMQNQNIPIDYDTSELGLNGAVNGYTFTLAKDTAHLREVGKKMHICVGTYGDKALSKRCFIVTVHQKGEVIACLEVNDKRNALVQAKIACNDRPNGKLREAIIEWAGQNAISSDCHDINSVSLDSVMLLDDDDDRPFAV